MDTKEESKIIFDAIEFAAKAHSGQFRKGTKIPYIVHPLGVAKLLIELDSSEEVIVAGILHDVVEDTHITIEEIKKHFGKKVADLVYGASEPNRQDSWKNRKQHTIDFLESASMESLMLGCADKLHNITSIRKDFEKHGGAFWNRFSRPKNDQKWYYKSLVGVFESRLNGEPGISLFKQFKAEVNRVFEG